ncbi:S9 family peptidase [Clostridium sp. DJ247]|uniref:alpha/beta hydrolase family protein n=1 Tax=Clostridium sp. DJ247 TaxID=2726188 RepID=UPI0016231A16|nr:alpha/beta hydrolase [Clostridium sp. DJ247]MBC2582516.1 alpha/beta hydrolase [Clostridium sp. DJ247]
MIGNFVIKNKAGIKIRGVINKPKGSGKIPCVVFCHGFTGNRMEHHYMFVSIAKALESINVASIRFDFTGSGESDGEFIDMSISTEIEDCQAVIEFCQTLDYIDKSNINILGFSMGGTIAVVNSANNTDVIKNTILISPAVDMYNLFISEVREEKLTTLIEKNYINFDGNLLSKKAVDDAFNYNIFNYVKQITQNVLIVHGTNDKSVPPMYSKKIEEILQYKARLKFVKGADHCYTTPEYHNELIEEIVSFAENNILIH